VIDGSGAEDLLRALAGLVVAVTALIWVIVRQARVRKNKPDITELDGEDDTL
jgi:hypothetical protein